MSPAAGATATVTVGRLIARVEDRFVPLRLFEERGRLRRGTNATYRLAKLALFDDPQENWLRVANHEVFGHGGRLRELFDGPHRLRASCASAVRPRRRRHLFPARSRADRRRDAGRDGGRDGGEPDDGARLAEDALIAGHWHYRDARRYLYAEYDTIHYIRRTNDHEKEGHDVGDFMKIYNEVATDNHEKTLNARTLRRRVLAGFANPMIAYSFYSTFVSYIRNGRETAPVPMLRIGATRYLPMARFQLTPFGTEWIIDNAFVRNGRFLDATVRAGQTIGARTWGVGLQTTRLAAWKRWTVGGEGHLWHQPEWGGEVTATADRRVGTVAWLRRPVSVVVQGGYKTNGFLAGERIHQGVVLRIGGRPAEA